MREITIRPIYEETTRLCWSLRDAIVRLQDAERSIPEEYREHAIFQIEAGYGGEYRENFEFEVSYERPQTAEEEAAEIRENEDRRVRWQQQQEAHERQALAMLKRKYESA